MSDKRILAALLAGGMVLGGTPGLWASDTPPPPPLGATPQPGDRAETTEAAPARIGYLNGQVSFWRPDAGAWAPATINTPLAPGDFLYTGPNGNVEVQIGARAFVRAAEGTYLGLDTREAGFVRFKVTAGHAALDLRELAPGQTVVLDTANAVLTIEHTGYYRVDVGEERTTFIAWRGGRATMTAAGGTAVTLSPDQQAVVTGTGSPRVEIAVAPELTAWDRWNRQRTDQLLDSQSARYVSPGVYGTQELDRYGSWRADETYGPVWVPSAVAPDWVPYSTGRWIWDPRYDWTWLDDAPWGWAPYHYGRWVFVNGVWAWAPGPIVVRPVYAPALVVFLGGPVVVGRPVCWAPLGWGEPVIPWWGGPGFAGHAWWGGWGGPHVVNNVVINHTTVVEVQHITVYRNVNVVNAVVGVPAERFGRDHVRKARLSNDDVRRLEPRRGPIDVRPVPASGAGVNGPATKPPRSVVKRAVVATRDLEVPPDTGQAGGPSRVPGVATERRARVIPTVGAAPPRPTPRLSPQRESRRREASVDEHRKERLPVPGPGQPARLAPRPRLETPALGSAMGAASNPERHFAPGRGQELQMKRARLRRTDAEQNGFGIGPRAPGEPDGPEPARHRQ